MSWAFIGSPTAKKRKTIEDNLKDILQCPVCLLVPNKPEKVNVCYNGHLICNECREKISLCPICRSDKLDLQSPLLKKIFDSLPSMCPNYGSGCQRSFDDGEELKEHENHCEFRRIDCIVFSCQERVTFENYIMHLRELHNAVDQTTNGSSHFLKYFTAAGYHLEKNYYNWRPAIRYFDNKTFIFLFYYYNNGLYGAECFFHGSEKEAKRDFCKITIINMKDDRFKINNCGEVIPMDIMKKDRTNHPGK